MLTPITLLSFYPCLSFPYVASPGFFVLQVHIEVLYIYTERVLTAALASKLNTSNSVAFSLSPTVSFLWLQEDRTSHILAGWVSFFLFERTKTRGITFFLSFFFFFKV